MFIGGNLSFFIAGGIAAQLSSIFDCADGMMARARNTPSRYGAFLDLFFDRITDFMVLSGVSIGWFRFTGDSLLLVLGLLGTGLYFLQVTLYYLMKDYKQEIRTGQAAEPRGLVIFIIFVVSLFGRMDIIIYVVILETAVNIFLKTIRFIRWGQNGHSS